MIKLSNRGQFEGEPILENKLCEIDGRKAPVTITEVVSTIETRSLIIDSSREILCGVYSGTTAEMYAPYPSHIDMDEKNIKKVPSAFIGREGGDHFFRIIEETEPIRGFLSRLRKKKPLKYLKIEKIEKELRYSETDKITTNFFKWIGTYDELVNEVLRDIDQVSLSKYETPAIKEI